MLHHFKLVAASVVLVASGFLLSGCKPQSSHPNQLNKFDGLAFDSLILAHGSITSLRASVANQYPSLAPQFNKVAEAYAAAVSAYSTYRTGASSDFATASALHDLTLSIVALEGEFEAMFRGNGQSVLAEKMSARAVSGIYSPSELLTALQLSVVVASAVPGLEGKAVAIQVILDAATQALGEWKAMASEPIDLSKLQPVPAIS